MHAIVNVNIVNRPLPFAARHLLQPIEGHTPIMAQPSEYMNYTNVKLKQGNQSHVKATDPFQSGCPTMTRTEIIVAHPASLRPRQIWGVGLVPCGDSIHIGKTVLRSCTSVLTVNPSRGKGKPVVGTVVQIVSIINRHRKQCGVVMIKCSSRSCGGHWSTRTYVPLECKRRRRTMSPGWRGCDWESSGKVGRRSCDACYLLASAR